MTTTEESHRNLATKEEVADHKVAIADAVLNLVNSQIKADERMKDFEVEFREIRTILENLIQSQRELTESQRELTESNRRVIGFQTSDDE